MRRRAVITGLGIVSAIGIGKEKFWNSLKNGISGVDYIKSFDASSFPCKFAAEASDFDPTDFIPEKHAKRLDRFAQFGIAAAKMAVADSGLDLDKENRNRMGVIVGTSVGALAIGERQHAIFLEKGYRRINPFFATSIIPSSASSQIMINLGISGPCCTITTACASSTSAVGEAAEMIKTGRSDIMIAGGSETPITPFAIGTFANVNLLTTSDGDPKKAYKTFDIKRDGLVFGEGSSLFVIEEYERAKKRGAKIYAEVLGYGATADAYHVMTPLPDAKQAENAVRIALKDAKVNPEKIDYINPHASGTIHNDRAEALTIRNVFGELASKIFVSATKPYTGHAMGGCGALEIAACLMMMENNFLHPMLNLTERDPECDLNFVSAEGEEKELNYVMKISFGFGGYNAVCIFKKI